MKRSALIILTAVYLLSCVGIGVNRFYCCGKLASVTFIYGSTDNTGKAAKNNNDCCKNEKQSFKIKDTHVSADSFVLGTLSPVILPSFNTWNSTVIIKDYDASIGYQSNAPPASPDIPIYTRNCTYRI